MAQTILLTGATGFVGGTVYPVLKAAGHTVRCATRRPGRARERAPGREWVELDVDRPETLAPALRGVHGVVYLVHGMGDGADYEAREREAARRFAEVAAASGVERIVYLGGVRPAGEPSRHLRSRLETGELLRAGPVPTFELRAGMLIGAGGESWQICRDLAARLPLMVLPRWLETKSQPLAVEDAAFAIAAALTVPVSKAGIYDLPGPEVLSGKEILMRVASLRGMRPRTLRVPLLTPRLSSYWLRFVTRANFAIAQELVEGLTSDLLARDRGFWTLVPEHRLTSFEDAARRALRDEEADLPLTTRLLEKALFRLSRH